jgi:two-component system, OmpR family, response regulator
VMLPDLVGWEVHRRLTDGVRSHAAVIFLTARRETGDRVRGLTIGADDYVVVPFSLEELIARVRAVLRRTRGQGEAEGPLRDADLELDEATREVRRGRLVELTPTEFRLLRHLIENAGRVPTKSQLLDRVWSYDFGGDSKVVETYISYLRRKIDRGSPPLIQTARGVGDTLPLRET